MNVYEFGAHIVLHCVATGLSEQKENVLTENE